MARGPYETGELKTHLRIRKCRIAAGMTQEELAVLLETSQATVARYERGEVDIKATKLLQIASALKMPVSELFEDGDGLTDAERDLIDQLRSNPRDRVVIESTLKALRDTESATVGPAE